MIATGAGFRSSFLTSARHLSGRERAALAFVTTLAGLLLIRALLPATTWWSFVLWIGLGALAGALAGQLRLVWLAWLATGIAYVVEVWLGYTEAPKELTHGLIAALLAGLLPGAGFILGAAIRGHRGAVRVVAVATLATAMVFGYAGVLGVIGADMWVASDGSDDCRTPAYFGWAYEAINYDQADDANLRSEFDGTSWQCPSGQGSGAGQAVVSADGAKIAGWYIPAGRGTGPGAATLLIVPGGKSSKSEMLKYAELLHDRYNLVMMDLRQEGRSSGTLSAGLGERLDVEAMIKWVADTKHPAWIGAMGASLGAASLLAAAVHDDRVQALVLDSMHATFENTVGNIMEREWGQPVEPGVWGIRAVGYVQLKGDVTDIDPLTSITRLEDRPVLLLHSEDDPTDRITQSAELNLQAGLAAGVPVQLVTCSGPGHGRLVDEDPCRTTWSLAVNSFLESAISR
jgi:pimeloyl-ACP methyl ester carboxylesterase